MRAFSSRPVSVIEVGARSATASNDAEESRLCRSVRLWRDPPADSARRGPIVDEDAKADRRMADHRYITSAKRLEHCT